MAHALVRKDDEPISPSICEWLVDDENDVSELPTIISKGAHGEPTCYPGSVAYVADL